MYLTKRVRADNSAFGRKHTFRIILVRESVRKKVSFWGVVKLSIRCLQVQLGFFLKNKWYDTIHR
jgi:hypothetical protein